MKSDSLIVVENVSKKFSKSFKRSLWYGIKDIAAELFGKKTTDKVLRKSEFWAVKDVSFELRRGECLGLIGHNGAGKSTLLKMLNGLIKPDTGTITMRGKVGALIELNAGLNPVLTGKENIYVLGQIRGFTKKEIDRKFDEIVEFAEIEEFIDSPVQNYSSGMRVRLGFSVAAQMEPDILLIDEVLAVGDMSFAIKSLRKIDELLNKSAVIFVSHSMPHVSRISNKLLLMKKGGQDYYSNDVSEGIDYYYSNYGNKISSFAKTEDIELLNVWFPESENTTSIYQVNRLKNLTIRFRVKIRNTHATPYLGVVIYDKEQRPVGVAINHQHMSDANIVEKEHDYNMYESTLVLPRINLSKGIYSITLAITEEFTKHFLLRAQNIAEFQVQSKLAVWEPIEFEGEWS